MGEGNRNGDLEYISSAIYLLKNYVRDKLNTLRTIRDSPAFSQQKADTETLINQFDLAVRKLESTIKPLDKRIIDSLNVLARQQKFLTEASQPPSMSIHSATPYLTVFPAKIDHKIGNAPPENKMVHGSPVTRQLNDRPMTSSMANTAAANEKMSVSCCPFCNRKYNIRTALNKHIVEEHPTQNEIYENISSLTPEFMLASEAYVGGKRQCFYCQAPFRSNAPLFRHIQEAHVDFFDIFVKISICRGDKMPSLLPSPSRSNSTASNARPCIKTPRADISIHTATNTNRAFESTNIICVPGNNVLCNTAITSPVHTESHINSSSAAINRANDRVIKTNDTSAISAPQNARKSIRTSTVTRASIDASPVSSSHHTTVMANVANGEIVQVKSTEIVQSKSTLQPHFEETEDNSATNKTTLANPKRDQVHSARKRRIIIGALPGPASKKLSRQQRDSDDNSQSSCSCSLCGSKFKNPKALAIHTSHYCVKRPPEVIEATKGTLPILPDGGITQSEVVSSSVVSSSSFDSSTDVNEDPSNETSDDEVDSTDPYEVPEHLKRALIRTVRDVDVILPMIHQEDLVACMRTPAFRKLQTIL